MADKTVKFSAKDAEKKAEAEFPPPPPPDSAQTTALPEIQGQNFMSVPPPKESFSKFYEQRQVNELKRLYRHMHPELRKNLEKVVTSEISEILKRDEPHHPDSVQLDTVLPGEVQSMRWIFENWNLDTIGEHEGTKKLAEDETVLGGNVKNTSLKFNVQPYKDGSTSAKDLGNDQTKGDVKTALWLFETQPLDSVNKIYPDETEVQEAVLKEPVEKGDVKGTTFLFETCSLDEVGRCNSVEEDSILQLRSEIQELKGDVTKTVKLFQTEPLCAIRDNTGNVHAVKSICREETESNSVSTARWLFETQPLDTIQKDTSRVQLIRGISLEEIEKGGVNAAKWLFETQPLDTIKEHADDGDFQASIDTLEGEGSSCSKMNSSEEVCVGDVKSTLWLFETQPMETLKGNFEVGKLKKVDLLNEEKGDVKQRKHIFESRSLDEISNMDEDSIKKCEASHFKEILKGDVKSFKNLFETLPLESVKKTSSIHTLSQEEIPAGSVKANQTLFETVPLYAIEDSLGNFHEVTSISREQDESGDVKSYKWMFETKPLDQFNDSPQKVDIIRGITKQEIMSGDVGTAKWLFETQPIDIVRQESNATENSTLEKKEALQKGDVKKCRWLFETQPIDKLYEKSEQNTDKEMQVYGDVKSCTWMFETQPLDSFKETEEQYINVKTMLHDTCKDVSVETTKHLFETEPLDNVSPGGKFKKVIRYSSRVEIPSGEVSRVKEIFETKPDECTSVKSVDIPEQENIQSGSVNKFTWLFENCPLDSMETKTNGFQEIPPEKDIKGGDVGGKKFIFETYTLDQIQQEEDEVEIKKIQESITRGDVKSCTMLFETKPLYAIQDKGGEYHEVTSVKKEEVLKGDVRGAKWLFETRPLDRINRDEEVFIIRAVTQEDIEKGCVKAARWRFETEPLDSGENKYFRKELEDVQKGDVQLNKELFESQQLNQKKYVRLVSVSDVQKGNVRTSTWLFENQPIDSLKGELEEHPGIITVQREDNQKGDVKRCTWLFESEPLDSLKDAETPKANEDHESILQANVKSTTWLFESTPLDKFERTTSFEQREIVVKDTIEKLLLSKIIEHKGIVIESVDAANVKMVKYQVKHASTEIQKEEIVSGNLQRILLQLLHRADIEPYGLLVEENSKGELLKTNLQLLLLEEPKEEEERHVQDNVTKALQILLNEEAFVKTGIVMEEAERGSVKIIIYSVSKYSNSNGKGIIKGDVKSTIGNLLAQSQESKQKSSVTREENEKGNVQLYTSCIEKGDLGYLKSLQDDSEIEALRLSQSQDATSIHEDTKKLSDLHDSTKITEGKGMVGEKCLYTASNSTPHCKKQDTKCREFNVTANVKLAIPTEIAQNNCKVEMNTSFQEEIAAKDFAPCPEEDDYFKMSPCTIQTNECASSSDLQTALLDLRQATVEAKSIQKQVQCKFQKGACDLQLRNEPIRENMAQPIQSTLHYQEGKASKNSANTNTLETQRSDARFRKATTKKVSAQEEKNQIQQLVETVQEKRVESSTESNIKDGFDCPKQVKNYLNPFINSDFMMQSIQEEQGQDIVRGDVKAAIRALQIASSEHRDVEKEEVVRGNLTSALQSLERSNVNVSKGDFKTAMIYRNAGQSHTVSKASTDNEQVRHQATVEPVSQSDNDFAPSSVGVTGHGQIQPSMPSKTKAQENEMTEASPLIPDSAAKEASYTLDENANALITPQPLMTQRKKPIPPPKPKHLLPGSCPIPRRRPKNQSMSMSSHVPVDPNDNGSDKTRRHSANTPVKQQYKSESLYASASAKEEETKMLTSKTNEKWQEKQETCMKEKSERSEKSTSAHGQPQDLHNQRQISENLTSTLLSPGLNTDKTYCQNMEAQDVSQCKRGVTIIEPNQSTRHGENQEVVMRVKRKKETEDEKRKRLSVHKDEIMKENVKAAMDIFDNLRKQDELHKILNKVKELEQDTSSVNEGSVKGLFESVPDWIVNNEDETKHQLKVKEDESFELLKDDTESISSVEMAFEDLEKASSEIKHLKEQTLARLLEIEETIKKALYSVSNLKSESDIAGLSGLFRESLGTPTSASPTNNIRKISIVSSKAKADKPTSLSLQKSVEPLNSQDVNINKKTELDVTSISNRAVSPASPSFITIESAARKPNPHTSRSINNGQISQSSAENSSQANQWSSSCDPERFSQSSLPNTLRGQSYEQNSILCPPGSPLNNQRQKSILELKTGKEGPKVIGTTVVTEKYEESDTFGNKIVRSKTSTTVTKQSDTHSSSSYQVVSAPPRFEVTASPLLKRHAVSSVDNSNSRGSETGVVFVTFGNSKAKETNPRETCFVCHKSVYCMERRALGDMVLHQWCLCCAECKRRLTIKNYFSLHGRLYCNMHRDQLTQGKSTLPKKKNQKEVVYKPPTDSDPCRDLKAALNPTERNLLKEQVITDMNPGKRPRESYHSNDSRFRLTNIPSTQDQYIIAARIKGVSRWSWPNLATDIPSNAVQKKDNRDMAYGLCGGVKIKLPKVSSLGGSGKLGKEKTHLISESKVREKVLLFQTFRTDSNTLPTPCNVKTPRRVNQLQQQYENSCTKSTTNQRNAPLASINLGHPIAPPKIKGKPDTSDFITQQTQYTLQGMHGSTWLPKITLGTKTGDILPIKMLDIGEMGATMSQSNDSNKGSSDHESLLHLSKPHQAAIQTEEEAEMTHGSSILSSGNVMDDDEACLLLKTSCPNPQ